MGRRRRATRRAQCRAIIRRCRWPRSPRSPSNTGGPIAGHHEVNAEGAGVSFGTHIVDVEVDPETGAVKILRYTVFQDAGKAVHPGLCRRSDAGRRGAGHRLGAERGIHLRRRRQAAERRLPRLPHAGRLGPADDRHGDPGNPQPRPPLRCARRGRDPDRAAAGRDCQCGVANPQACA